MRIGLALLLCAFCGSVEAATLTITTNGTVSGAVGVTGGNVCNPDPGGSGGGTCVFTYPAGTALRIMANSPNTPGVFNAGTGDAASCATSTCNFTLNNDSAIFATFAAGPVLSIVIGLGGDAKGTIYTDNSTCQNFELGYSACTVFYAPGSEVIFQGAVTPGSIFVTFSGGTFDAAACMSAAPCIFTLTQNSSVNASFAALTSVAVTPNPESLNVGQTRTFTATGTFSNSATRSLYGQTQFWRTKTPMVTARFSLAAAVVGDRLYAIGGVDGACVLSPCPFGPLATVEMYNPAAFDFGTRDSWTPRAPMLIPREGVEVAVAGGKIYALGGHTTGGSSVGSMEAYDPIGNSWTSRAAMLTTRAGFAAVAINNIIYAVGGGEPSAPLDTLEAYDATANTWTAKSPMPIARAVLAAATVNGKIYVIGGPPDTTTLEEYDPVADAWTTKTAMPVGRGGIEAAAIDGLIYVVGGEAPTAGAVDVYNPATDSWAALTPMPTARGQFGLAVLDGRLFAAGGLTASNTVLATLEGFRPPETTWWSSNAAVATISQNNGTATANSNGTSIISARSVGIASTLQSATLTVAASSPTVLRPPTAFAVSTIVGNTVTFTWLAPTGSITPASYVIEGGVVPGQVLGSMATGSANVFSVALPSGAFYIRAHSVAGGQRSGASNEIQAFVNMPTTPSAPAGLLGAANGSQLALAWSNTFAGGAPAGLILDVTGATSLSLPLPLSTSFTFDSVPAGIYNLALRASNAAGTSGPSNMVTLTFPSACEVPNVPTHFTASRSSSTLTLSWEPPATGPAPSAYGLVVTGAFVGDLTLQGLGASATLASGTYSFALSAITPCGRSASTPVQTVTIP
jgi:hypothetical protein